MQSQACLNYAECSQPSQREKGLGESGGALFKGKEGRGDFRKTSFERRQVQSDTAMGNKKYILGKALKPQGIINENYLKVYMLFFKALLLL